MKTGLIVGKFAPLHDGHEYLLRTAAHVVDTLIVLVYDAPDVTRVPVSVRASWIRTLYPKATVLEGTNSPPRGVWNEETMQAHEKFIKNLVASYHITHVFSGEEYGERLGRTLSAEHLLVEKIFGDLPLSASALKREPALYQQYVRPNVRDDAKKYGDM